MTSPRASQTNATTVKASLEPLLMLMAIATSRSPRASSPSTTRIRLRNFWTIGETMASAPTVAIKILSTHLTLPRIAPTNVGTKNRGRRMIQCSLWQHLQLLTSRIPPSSLSLHTSLSLHLRPRLILRSLATHLLVLVMPQQILQSMIQYADGWPLGQHLSQLLAPAMWTCELLHELLLAPRNQIWA